MRFVFLNRPVHSAVDTQLGNMPLSGNHGVINGYVTSPPCAAGTPCFMPGTTTTRGQLVKVVILAFGLSINTSGGPHFLDVPVGSSFYPYVETGVNLGLWQGYPNGNFGPGDPVNRGQVAKILVNAAITTDPAHWTLENPSSNTFADVGVGTTFFRYIETAAPHGLVAGYPCGLQPGEPCMPPGNTPYYRPTALATRAQVSKITVLAATYGR